MPRSRLKVKTGLVLAMVVLAGLAAGCLRGPGKEGGPTPSSTSPLMERGGFNLSRPSGGATLLLPGYTPRSDGLLFGGVTTDPVPRAYFAWLGLRNPGWNAQAMGSMSGSWYEGFGTIGDASSYVVMSLGPNTGGIPHGRTWIDLARFEDNAWTLIDENPPRWFGGVAQGVATGSGVLWVLVRGPVNTELWSLREGAWSSEVVPGFTVAETRLVSNGTHLFVVGSDLQGNVLVDWRPVGQTSGFASSTLQGADAAIRNVLPVVATATRGYPPVVAWTRTDPQGSAPDRTYVAHVAGSSWRVEEIAKGLGVRDLGVSQTAAFVALGGSTSWSLWEILPILRSCNLTGTERLDGFVSADANVTVVYGGAKAVGARLEPAASRCLPGDSKALP